MHVATYRETTAGQSISLTAREWRTESGWHLESASSGGDRHVVVTDADLRTRSWSFRDASESVLAQREGGRVAVTVRNSPESPVRSSGSAELGDHPWIQSIERSLRPFVLGGNPGDRLRFSVVQPDTLSVRTLQAQIMGDERVAVDGDSVDARLVRISLPGIGSLFWRSFYWYRLPDGLFVRSEVTRGPPGTPETVVVLTGERDDAEEARTPD